MKKTTIRSKILKLRQLLSADQCQQLSQQVVQHILHSKPYQQAQHVALYLPFNGEVDLTSLLQHEGKQHYLPSIQGKRMQFQPYATNMVLNQHDYGLKQPAFDASLQPVQLDLCLMPMVAFDMQGNRLGMGGGFYDRYFAVDTKAHHITQLAGIGYQFQQQQKLPTQNWDVKINHLYTEQGYFKL